MGQSNDKRGFFGLLMVTALVAAAGCTGDARDSERDAGTRNGAAGTSGAGGTGAQSGSGGAGGFVPGDFGPNSCTRPLPDPGDDACLTCALENCCGPGPGVCVAPPLPRGGPGQCYADYFGCIQGCFAGDDDAGVESSLERVDRCVAECQEQLGASVVNALVDCVLGSPLGADAGTDDGGTRDADGPCVEPCFPGWR